MTDRIEDEHERDAKQVDDATQKAGAAELAAWWFQGFAAATAFWLVAYLLFR